MRNIVLVVDDSIDELTMISETLESAGTTTLVARDGQSALAIVDRVTPDAILMDAVMPGMDGFETCRRLKQKSAIADVPVIFMTGLSDTDHVLMGFEAGGVDYVTKPVVAEEFLARIRTHVANSRRARSATIALDFLRPLSSRGRSRGTSVVVDAAGRPPRRGTPRFAAARARAAASRGRQPDCPARGSIAGGARQ